MDANLTYLLINMAVLAVPLLFSFEKRIRFVSKWKFAFSGIALTGGIFIVWDHFFTKAGVWGFNPEYMLGIHFAGLPLEEILFFLTIPFASLFLYENFSRIWHPKIMDRWADAFFWGIAALGVLLMAISGGGAYTFTAALAAAAAALAHLLVGRDRGAVLFTYLVHLVPFFIVNGILTALPVVWYNDFENLSIRLGSIPVEDLLYAFALLVLNITFYQVFSGRENPEPKPSKITREAEYV